MTDKPEYTEVDLGALLESWLEMFSERLSIGYVIGPAQVPIIKECLKTRSQKPLEDYIDSLPKDRLY